MPTAVCKIRNVAGSVVVSIPKRLLEDVGLKQGDRVELVSDKLDNSITMRLEK